MWGQGQSLLPSLTCRPPQTSCRRTVGRSVGFRGSQPHNPHHRPYNNLKLTLSAAALTLPLEFSPGAAPGLFPEAAVNLVSDRSHDCRVCQNVGKTYQGVGLPESSEGHPWGAWGQACCYWEIGFRTCRMRSSFLFSGLRKFSR